MKSTSDPNASEWLPPRRELLRGWLLGVVMALAFLILTAYQTAATLLSRVAETDVMKAATDSAWSGRVGLEIAWFLAAVVLLHVAMGTLAWVLACASAVTSANVRAKLLRYVIGWFALLAAATIAYAALWHPRTLLGAWYHDHLSTPVGPLMLGQLIYYGAMAGAAAALLSAAWRGLRSPGLDTRWRATAAAVPVLLAGFAVASLAAERPAAAAHVVTDRPHVIFIGIDSLRLDEVRRYGGHGLTPNLDAFIAQADLFKDASTPLARTFPSWVSILTSRSPPRTGARYNLGERSRVKTNPTIGDLLRAAGYQSIYSTDEVRFANIDETYGFDRVITPRIGAADFVIGTYNELPLSAVVINTRLGKWLFPFSYANRGVASMFEPETYVERLDRELSFDRPTFFITHLTASHWPYYTADTPFGIPNTDGEKGRPLYEAGLRTADAMFGEIIEMLKRKGALENAIVVVLSDHGEALGLPDDTFINAGTVIAGLKAPLKMMDMGHGQSVLSPMQYKVLLGFRAFGPHAPFATKGRSFQAPADVEDIAPTILDLLGIHGDPLASSGQSLASMLRTGTDALPPDEIAQRIRYTETDLKVLPSQNGGVDEDATARENSKFFELDPRTARLHIRENYAPLAIAFKERAAFTADHLLAAIPAGPDAHQYLFFDVRTGNGRLLLERPGADDPIAQRLWDAMGQHYGKELKTPVATTMDDWPKIDTAWSNFFQPRTPWRGDGPDYPAPPGGQGG
ncbi:MAG: sulfatase-like hydrolase/transferase [Steroidobacteraceae bacterium]